MSSVLCNCILLTTALSRVSFVWSRHTSSYVPAALICWLCTLVTFIPRPHSSRTGTRLARDHGSSWSSVVGAVRQPDGHGAGRGGAGRPGGEEEALQDACAPYGQLWQGRRDPSSWTGTVGKVVLNTTAHTHSLSCSMSRWWCSYAPQRARGMSLTTCATSGGSCCVKPSPETPWRRSGSLFLA